MFAPYQMKHDRFTSTITGREYPFVKDADGSSRRAALAQLQTDAGQVMNANNERAMRTIGRPLSIREHLQSNWIPDTRDMRAKIAEDGVFVSAPPHDPNRNPHAATLAELRSRHITPAERAGIQRRIETAQRNHDAWEAERAKVREREALMSSQKVSDARADAGAWLARLHTNPTVPQQWVDDAAKRLTDLQQTGDTDAYWRETFTFEAERESVLNAHAGALDAEARALKADAAAVRRGEPIEVLTSGESENAR